MTISQDTVLGLHTSQIVGIVGQLAGIAASTFAPGLTLGGMSIAKIAQLAVGVANQVPEAITAFNDIKAVQASGQAPTKEQWAKWNAAADDAHAKAQAAAD